MVFLLPMPYLNVEIKARTSDPGRIRSWLESHKAEFKGTDHQKDTYFNVAHGRLKLREGNIENNLIYYERKDQQGPKDSQFQLISVPDAQTLKEVLARAIGIKVVVEKKREIWFIDNVKFHLDEVPGLGSFAEIEAGNLHKPATREELQRQCDFYLKEFEIEIKDLLADSYSDMLLNGVT
jgi:adenylate cyclase class 2